MGQVYLLHSRSNQQHSEGSVPARPFMPACLGWLWAGGTGHAHVRVPVTSHAYCQPASLPAMASPTCLASTDAPWARLQHSHCTCCTARAAHAHACVHAQRGQPIIHALPASQPACHSQSHMPGQHRCTIGQGATQPQHLLHPTRNACARIRSHLASHKVAPPPPYSIFLPLLCAGPKVAPVGSHPPTAILIWSVLLRVLVMHMYACLSLPMHTASQPACLPWPVPHAWPAQMHHGPGCNTATALVALHAQRMRTHACTLSGDSQSSMPCQPASLPATASPTCLASTDAP